ILTAAPVGLTVESAGAFVKIDGREALLRSIELFLNRPRITQHLLVFSDDIGEEAKKRHAAHLSFSGVKPIIAGLEWFDQLKAVAAQLNEEITHVIVHDAARPAVPAEDIDRLLDDAPQHPAVVLATPSRTALVEID